MQELTKQLQDANSLKLARTHSLNVNAIEHQDRLYKASKRAAEQWRDELVAFGKTGTESLFHELWKRDRKDGGAGSLSDGN